jgi:ADP-heptose:LPS heptosyltransferase
MMKLTFNDVKTDCRHFRGDIPCRPHKEHAVHCVEEEGAPCPFYDPVRKRVLIIKLGALGDVIRTTPLLRKLRATDPTAEIWWLTRSPEVLPRAHVDVILPFTVESIAVLQATPFEVVFNLDKDREACAILSVLTAGVKRGFTLANGKCIPQDASAEHKYLTGIFDDLSKANTKSYQAEIFEICGQSFGGEEYIMPDITAHAWKLPARKKVVGLNTGCGGRWISRLWPDRYWVRLAKKLKKAGYVPLLLGGEQEHAKNQRLAKASGALYLGHFPLGEFMSEVDRCDLVVTAVTMAMHIAIGLRKKIVLFNNIFNRHEFELYGRGEILEPDFQCSCFYSPTCPNNCMQYLTPERVFEASRRLLAAHGPEEKP